MLEKEINQKKKYNNLFFDLDHTLWDFETNAQESLEEIFIDHELEKQGIPAFADFHTCYCGHNEILWEKYRNGKINREELRWKRMWLTLMDFKIGNQELAYALSDRYLEILPTKKALFPDTIEVLDYLTDKNYPLHLITNGFEETQMMKIKNAGISRYFTHIVTSEKANSLKPQREIFDFAMQLTNAQPEESLMIGDALNVDILGAKNAGIDQIYYNPTVPAEAFQPTYTITKLRELKEIL